MHILNQDHPRMVIGTFKIFKKKSQPNLNPPPRESTGTIHPTGASFAANRRGQAGASILWGGWESNLPHFLKWGVEGLRISTNLLRLD